MVLTWPDGIVSRLPAPELRAACSCATCRDEAGLRATEQVLQRPDEIRIAGAELVGNYAVNLIFEPDHHTTGIFPWDLLRELVARSQ